LWDGVGEEQSKVVTSPGLPPHYRYEENTQDFDVNGSVLAMLERVLQGIRIAEGFVIQGTREYVSHSSIFKDAQKVFYSLPGALV